MNKDRVSGVQSSDVVPSDDLVDVEEDDLDESHDQELNGTGHSDHGSEGDEDGGHGEVGVDESLYVDVDPRSGVTIEIVVISLVVMFTSRSFMNLLC